MEGAPALPQPSASCDVGRAPRPPVGTGAKLLSRPPSELLSRPPRGSRWLGAHGKQRRPGDLRTTGTCAAQPGPH